jgi:hypothetical protein
MLARYGNQWTSKWPDQGSRRLAMAEWTDRLRNLSDDQIREGMERWRGDWPPNVEEFYNTAQQYKGWEHGGDAYKPFQKQLPKPKARQSVVNEQLAQMRAALGRKKPRGDDQ